MTRKALKRKPDWLAVLHLCMHYWFQDKARLALQLAIIICMVGADILMPIAAGNLVDAIVGNIRSGSDDFSAAYTALTLFAVASLAFYLLAFFRGRVMHSFEAPTMAKVVNDAFWKVQRFSSDWHANTFAGATVRKILRGKWAYQMITDIILKRFFQLGLTVLGLTIVLWTRFPLLGILFLVSTTIYIAVSIAISGTYVRQANIRSAAADSAIGAAIADAITNNPAVKAFGAETREDERFSDVTAKWRDMAKISWNRGHDLWLIQQIIWGGLQVTILFAIIYLAGSGRATPGDAAFILTATFRLRGFMGQVGENIRHLQRASSEFADIVGFSRQSFQVEDSQDAGLLKRSGGKIEFDSVTFGYEGAFQPIYKDFSLTIQPGERIGLVGPSGSGKSTFLKLIHRLYDTDEGEIRIDGQPIKSIHQESLRQAIALVPQDPALFHRTLADNIAYGRPDATLDDVKRAAKRARADHFIARLPEGLDTLVGERGVKLSGGERQRVAIARAFLADAPIVIFDEATSSLDTITERLIQHAMTDLMDGRTTLIVAHRLSTVRDVDRILVFDQGQIVEEGTHDSLLRKVGGRYRELYEMQSEENALPPTPQIMPEKKAPDQVAVLQANLRTP